MVIYIYIKLKLRDKGDISHFIPSLYKNHTSLCSSGNSGYLLWNISFSNYKKKKTTAKSYF